MADKPKQKVMATPEELDELLNEVSKRMDRLKVQYENYFMGIDKVEPHTQRKDVARRILNLQQEHIRNSGQRFRFNMIAQKFGVYQTYWSRTMREIEAGTYKKHIAMAARNMAKRGLNPDQIAELVGARKGLRKKHVTEAAKATADALALTRSRRRGQADPVAPSDQPPAPETEAPAAPAALAAGPTSGGEFDNMLDELFADGPSPFPPTPTSLAPRPPAPPPAAAPPPPPLPRVSTQPRVSTAPPGMSDDQMQALYKRYQQARRLAGQDAETVKYESLVAQLSKQTPGILKQHGVEQVDFSVVVRDNKVVLKAVPKK